MSFRVSLVGLAVSGNQDSMVIVALLPNSMRHRV